MFVQSLSLAVLVVVAPRPSAYASASPVLDIFSRDFTSCSIGDSGQLSCHNTTAVSNSCCFNTPGGQLLQTQFWDTAPATGPSNSWTVHGLWPDNCDGSFEASCDQSRESSDIAGILQSFGKTDVLSYMQTYWKDYKGDDETFWEHEWNKHGTCISTLEPGCYTDYKEHQEIADFFEKTVELFKSLNTFEILSAAGIKPSDSETYTMAAIQGAIQKATGKQATVNCKSGVFNEVWYHFNVKGRAQDGQYVHADPIGSKSTCPSSGIKYRVKGGSPAPTSGGSTVPGPTPPPANPSPAPGNGAPFSGKGYLNVDVEGTKTGCLISSGTWYSSGTCATFTAAGIEGGITLTSSKGKCGIVNDQFTCSDSVTMPSVFTNSDGFLASSEAGGTTFYADAVPEGSAQQKIYTKRRAQSLKISFQALG